jgi:glycosyltransferase involved in cell wall biosynthesis
MIVMNEMIRDGRVLRAARALADRYDLTLLGVDKGSPPIDPTEQRRRLGLNAEWVPLRRSGQLPRNMMGYSARYVEAFARLLGRCIQLRPDVIHAHDNSALPVAMSAKAAIRCKVVYDAHELYRDQLRGPGFGWLAPIHAIESWAMKHCAGIIACNHWRAEIMRDEYGAPFLPTVVRNVPEYYEHKPSELLRAYARERNPQVRRVVLHQGGIQVGRGLDVVVRALPMLPEDVAVVFMGSGAEAYLRELTDRAAELGVGERFFIHPAVHHTELPEYTCSADVGVVIYQNICRNNYFCAPNKLYEYASAGLPTVGADLPPIREFLEEFGTGAVFDTDDPRSLADAVRTILADEPTQRRYHENCLSAAKVMCWENESTRLLDLYEHVLGPPAGEADSPPGVLPVHLLETPK